MESPFYGYYYVSTDCLSNKWETKDIENYLDKQGIFIRKSSGLYECQIPFCSIQLLDVRSYDSWNSNDYNENTTNYISIVTSKDAPESMKDFFNNFSVFLGWNICEENI